MQSSIFEGIWWKKLADGRKKCENFNSWKCKNFLLNFKGVCSTLSPKNRGYPDVLQTFNFHILPWKWHFGTNIPPQFGQKRKWPKMTKNLEKSQNWAHILVPMGLYGENNLILCGKSVLGRFGTKSINKKKISVFSLKNHDFSKKKIQKAQKPCFWAQKPSLMCFLCVFSPKLMDKTKLWDIEKVYLKYPKM